MINSAPGDTLPLDHWIGLRLLSYDSIKNTVAVQVKKKLLVSNYKKINLVSQLLNINQKTALHKINNSRLVTYHVNY